MEKKRLAVISSYNELCGIASYTRGLVKALSNYFEVTVLELDVELLRKGKRKKVDKYIKDFRSKLKEYDSVNIQLEYGLFGTTISSMQKNFFSLLKASKNPVITFHSYNTTVKIPGILSFIKSCLNKKILGCLEDIKNAIANNRHALIFKRTILFCKKNEIPIIVHTKREKNRIQTEHETVKVYDHPLCLYEQNEINNIKNNYSKECFYKDLNLNSDKKYIGLFGFINKYKGHETAIRSLLHLPENYELLICGAQHPHQIRFGELLDPYIEKLLSLVKELNLSQRVKFYRFSNDDDFLKVLLHCDYNVLPYLEIYQSGSAIATLSLETNSKAIFSQNFLFFELDKYAKDCFPMFTIGNYKELADSILNYNQSKYAENLERYHKHYNIKTSAELYKALLMRLNDPSLVSVANDLQFAESN